MQKFHLPVRRILERLAATMDSGSSHITKTVRWAILTAAALFFLFGVSLLPYAGLQNDECLFVQPFYGPAARPDMINVFHRDVPVMLMSYLGTAKTLLYWPVLHLWQPTVWSIRLPALITGTATIWMFGLLLYRLGGSFAAIAGSFLLALDPSYLLTSVFDWGPVALQHFLLVGSALALVHFHKSGAKTALGAAFLALGLGMWDKALFSWMLAGLVVASLIFLLPEIRRRLTAGNVLVAAVAFLVGSAPLVIYNVRNNLGTFRGNTKLSAAEIWPKVRAMPGTLNGSGLFGYLIREEGDGSPLAPRGLVERIPAAVRGAVGERRKGWLPQALVLVALLVPLWWTRWRVMGFAFVTALVATLLMTATTGAGGSVHHVVLLWPVPQFLVALGLATVVAKRAAWLSWVACGVVAVVCVTNVLVVNQYLYNVQRVGPGASWTDAIFPLEQSLEKLHPEHVNLMDWGYESNVMALSGGKLEVHWGAEAGERETPNESDERLLQIFLERAPASVWVRRLEPIEVVPGTEKRFTARALERGYEKVPLELVEDRNGRKVFEIYRFVKVKP